MSAKAANQMQEVSFNLRMTSKQLQRQSKKCEKSEKTNRKKVAEAMKKGNMVRAVFARTRPRINYDVFPFAGTNF